MTQDLAEKLGEARGEIVVLRARLEDLADSVELRIKSGSIEGRGLAGLEAVLFAARRALLGRE